MHLPKLSFSLALFISLSCLAGETRSGDNYALVIIDMQPDFVTRGGHDKDVANVKKVNDLIQQQIHAIELAKSQKMPIVFLEYVDHGDTNSLLKQAVTKYSKVKYFRNDTGGLFDPRNKYGSK